MSDREIRYRAGYKYQLAETYGHPLPSLFAQYLPADTESTDYLALTPQGMLIIGQGYAWDGPSGPTVDTPDSMRGSLVHDALYQLIRLGLLPADARKAADLGLYRLCIEDGMAPLRARVWYDMVRAFAGAACHPSAERPVLVAPGPPVLVCTPAPTEGGVA